jgi:8-oxo-dGTP diphosphatase
MEPLKVVCALIWKEGQVFICRRKPGKSLAGFWEFPGGKLEENENLERALERELEEELGMRVAISGFFGRNVHHYDSFSIELTCYECRYISATFQLIDHDEIAFINPAELRKYNIAPADQFIVDKLL